MIKIYLLDFSGAEADNFSTSALPSFILETKNGKLRRERIFSYLLLSHAYCENFNLPMPDIERDENGKPYFALGSVRFNLSHTDNLAAVIISDEGDVGIDVQKVSPRVSEGLMEKVEKSPLIMEKSETLTEPNFLRAEGDRLLPNEPDFSCGNETSFFRKWTEREALAKADGVGLSLLSKILAEDFILISEGVLKIDRDKYFFSAVKKK